MDDGESHLRYSRFGPLERDHAGRPLCRACKAPLPPGRHYCGPLCRRDFLIRASRTVARQEYLAAYGDRCVQCGVRESAARAAHALALAILTEVHQERLLLPFECFPLDHIRPVADGGGECGLDNYRMLCAACHGPVTQRFRRDRRNRRSQGPWEAAARDRSGYRVPLG
jgi:5-methylcytosine-specific restriction protein A